MKILHSLLSLVIGYLAAVVFFSIFSISWGGVLFTHDYWVVLIWIAIFGFSIGSVVTIPSAFIFKKGSVFWRSFLGVPFGSICAFLSMYFSYRPLAIQLAYSGQAIIMGGITFLVMSLLYRKAPIQSELSTPLCTPSSTT